MKKKDYIFISISLLAVTLSIAAICNTHPRDLGIDYLGWIVGVLALITAILLGWNIYAMIDIKESHKKYMDVINEVDISQHKQIAVQEYTNWMIYHQLLLKKDPLGLEYSFLHHAVLCLYHTSCIRDFKTCEVILKGMNECLASPENIKMRANNKVTLLEILSKVKEKQQIKGYKEVLEKILSIQAF